MTYSQARKPKTQARRQKQTQNKSIVHKGKTGDSGWWNDVQRKIIHWHLNTRLFHPLLYFLSKSNSRRNAGHTEVNQDWNLEDYNFLQTYQKGSMIEMPCSVCGYKK